MIGIPASFTELEAILSHPLQPLRPLPALPPNTAPIHETTTVCQAKSTHRMTAVTKMILNSLAPRRPDHPVSPLLSRQVPTITSPSFPPRLRSSVRSEGLLSLRNHAPHRTRKTQTRKTQNVPQRCTSFAQCPATTADAYDIGQAPIDVLSDDDLLEIFDFCVHETKETNRWMSLVHVCQRWRNIVFGSPLHLDLQLVCSDGTPVKGTLDIWPPLPIVIDQNFELIRDMDNILAALEPNDRIYKITLLCIPRARWQKVLPAMQRHFPALTYLKLASSETSLVAADQILGGSAPRLRVLALDGIPFRGLPNLLLSTTDLVALTLYGIPHSGYISPEMIVPCLSTLTRLKFLLLGFESPRSGPDRERQRHPPPTRAILPALTTFLFRGVSEYLEDLVSRIDAPQLDQLSITFFHQLIFDTPQLTQFISRIPTLNVHDQASARVVFSGRQVHIVFPRAPGGVFGLSILCRLSVQLSTLAQLCTSSFPQSFIPMVEHLYIVKNTCSRLHWQDDIERSQWLEFLHPFTAVKNLYLSEELVSPVAQSLQDLVEGQVTDSLPALQSLFLEEEELHPSGPAAGAIGRVVAARQSSDHPIAISPWRRDRPSRWVFGSPEVYTLPVFFE